MTNVYRENVQECLRMAENARDKNDRHLWITMAHSWARLAEQTAHASADAEQHPMAEIPD
jgi:hypothetical protein